MSSAWSAATVAGQSSPITESRELAAKGIKAAQSKDLAEYLRCFKEVVRLRPDHLTYLYRLADAHAVNGNDKDALFWLNRIADMGMTVAAAKNPSFQKLSETPEFKAVVAKFERNVAPTGSGTPVFRLAERDLLTESVAFDPVENRFYAGSIHKRKILVVARDGTAREFVSSGQDGLMGVFGIKIDAKSRVLWACSSVMPQMDGFRKEDDGLAGVFKFDLKTGKLLKKYLMPNTPDKHVFGDLALHSNGDVFVSDSGPKPVLYRIPAKGDALVPFVEGGPFSNLQGITFSPDQKRLFVADYAAGVFVVDMKTKAVSKLEQAETVTMLGIDGLYFYKDGLIAVQNGINPQRIVRFRLNKKFDRVERFEVLESNSPALNEPTLGVLDKSDFYVVANSQWEYFGEDGNVKADKLQEPTVLRIRLN